MSKNSRLKQFFESEDITQKEFAKKLESTQQYVSALLNGKRKVGSNIIDRLEKEFNINTVWLLTGEGEMKKGEPGKELGANDEQDEYRVSSEEIVSIRQDIRAVNENLLALTEGVKVNFERIAMGIDQGLKNDLKVIRFIEQINVKDITRTTDRLTKFFENK